MNADNSATRRAWIVKPFAFKYYALVQLNAPNRFSRTGLSSRDFFNYQVFCCKMYKKSLLLAKAFFFQNCIHQLNECRQLFNQACLDCETFGVQILCTRPIECTASFFSNRSQLQISFWKIRIFSVKYAKNLYFFVELHVYFSQVLYPDRTERDTRRWVCVPPPHHHAIDGVCSCVYWLLL